MQKGNYNRKKRNNTELSDGSEAEKDFIRDATIQLSGQL